MAEASEDLVLLIGSIDGKMDILLAQSQDHQTRLVALEKDKWRLGGLLAGVSAISAWLFHDKVPSISALFH